jgi:hypothetical protein
MTRLVLVGEGAQSDGNFVDGGLALIHAGSWPFSKARCAVARLIFDGSAELAAV